MDAYLTEAEVIASAYRRAHRGDDRVALVAAIRDALIDLDMAKQRLDVQVRQVSRGYIRAAIAGG